MAIIETWTKLAGGLYLEGLTVAADGAVWCSDVIGGGVHGQAGGQPSHILHQGRMWIGGLVQNDRGHILCTGQGGIFAADPDTGVVQCVLDTIDGQPINGINEMAADGRGGLYFGTIDLDAVLAAQTPGAGQLFHLSANGTVSCVYPHVGFANGMVLSADGSTLYLNESFDGTYAFNVAPEGGLSNRRRILVKPDCDGMALDCEGNVWVTGFQSSHLTRLSPSGEEMEPVATLAPAITQIRFGGDDMRDVYITAVPADAGERLAEGKLPEGEVSFLYRGRSSVAGFKPPKITLGAIQ